MRLIVLIFLVVSSTANAGFFNKKLTVYRCSSGAVGSCDSSCKKDSPTMEMEFKVSKTNKAVQQIVFDDGKQVGAIVLENCIIFDDKNWTCEPGQYVVGYRKMANGIYSDNTQFIGLKTPNPPANICAK